MIISKYPEPSSTGFQTYNALQAVLQKRISNGLEGQVAYTWSHCLTNNSGYYGTWGSATQATPGSPYYQNLYDPHADYASCYFDSKNILAAYATYDLPIGKGKMIGNDMNSVVNAVVGGWQASTIISIHSGFPLAVYDAHRHFGHEWSWTSSQLRGTAASVRAPKKLCRLFPGLSVDESEWIFGTSGWDLRQLPGTGTSRLEPVTRIRTSVC